MSANNEFLSFDFEGFEASGGDKNQAVNYLKTLDLGLDFEDLENKIATYNQENQTQYNLYDVLKSQSKSLKIRKPQVSSSDIATSSPNFHNEGIPVDDDSSNLATLQKNHDKITQDKQDFETFKQAYTNEGLADKALQSAKEAVDFILPVFSVKEAFSGDKRSEYLERISQEIHKKIEQGGDFNSLDDAQKKFLEEKYQSGEETPSIFDSKFWDKDRKKGAEGVFERLKSKHQIAQKEANSLSESEKSLVKEEVGFWNNAFNSVAGLFTDESKESRNFEDFKNAINAKSEVTAEIQEAVNTLSLIHKNNNLLKILTSDNEESKALKEDYLQSLSKIAELHNFDDVGIDKKGEIYFFKTDESGNERAYHINTGFIDNFLGVLEDSKFEIGGSLIGAMAGAKKGLSKGAGSWQKVLFNAVAGSAIGAFSGAGVDYNLANAKLNREGDFEEFIAYASQAGLLDLAGSGVMAGISKVGVKEALSKTFKTAFNTADKIASNIPSFGFVYRTGKNFKQGQNFEGASKLIKESLSDEQRAAIDTLSKDFGGAVQSNAKDTTQQILSTLENVVNQKMPNSKLAEKLTSLNEALSDTSLASRRAKLVDYIRADESGLNVGILTQVASSNPKANLALRELLAKTSQSLENQLSNLKINQKDLREIFKGFESESKEAYNEAIDKTLLSAFKNERVQIDVQDFAKFANEIKESGLILEVKDKNFLNALSKNLYNEKGVSLEQLVNLRKSLNANFKEIKDPNLKSHFQNAIENFIKKDIDEGIEAIFKSNPKVTTEALRLFKTANEEYSNLKSIIKNAKKLKVFDEAAKKEKIVRNITEFAKGQGMIKGETSPFKSVEKEAVLNDFSSYTKPSVAPKELNIDEFLSTLEQVKNKENFIKHLQDKLDANQRLAYLNLVEPTLKEPNLKFKKGERETYLKAFSKEGEDKPYFYLLITEENGQTLITGFKTTREDFIKEKIKNADLIQAFTSRDAKNAEALLGASRTNHTTNNLNNLESLTKGLKESDIKDIEMQVLEGLYKDNLKEFKNGLKIFDSTAFLDNLKNLQSYPFKSSEAKDFIKYTQDFHKLFSQDAKIASSIYEPKANNTSSTLATSISGALQVKFINGIMEAVMRNLSLPFFLRGGELEQKIAKNALKYQLSKALEQSSGLSEFKQVLQARTKKGDFSNGTKKALEEFNKALEKTEKEFYDSIKQIENNPSLRESEVKPTQAKEELENPSQTNEDLPQINHEAQNAGNENIALANENNPLGRGNNLTQSGTLEHKGNSLAELDNENLTNQSLKQNEAIKSLKNEINPNDLNEEQRGVFEVLTGKKDKIVLQGRDINDLYTLEQGSRAKGAKKILIKHAGLEKTGGVSNDELLNMIEVVRKGELNPQSFTQHENFIRYAYDLNENNVNLRLVVEEHNNGKKVFDFYSDRNFKAKEDAQPKEALPQINHEAQNQNSEFIANKNEILEKMVSENKNTPQILKQSEVLEAEVIENEKPLKNQNAFKQLSFKNDDKSLKNINLDNLMRIYSSQRDFLDVKQIANKLLEFHKKPENNKQISFKKIKEGYILDDLLNVDEDITYAVVRKSDLKPSLTRSNTQFRARHSNSTISNIKTSFNEREHFKESSNFDGLPTITKEGLVIAGNHRTTAIKDLSGENLQRYIKQAKKIYGEDIFKNLPYPENEAMIVRVLHKNDDETIIRLSKLSNDGRLSSESEKLEALGAKYKEKLENIENAKGIDSDKMLMNYLGSKDALEAKRALLDHLMPDIQNALLAWEKRSGGDTEFSRILNENAINLLHLKQAIARNKTLESETKDFFKLFKGTIENINNTNQFKSSNDLYEAIKKYSVPSLNFEKEFIPNHRDLQSDILGFIIKYNDSLTNPSEALESKIKQAIKFIDENNTPSMFDEIKIGNYDILNQMLQANITQSNKYQDLLSRALETISKETSETQKALNKEELKSLNSKQSLDLAFTKEKTIKAVDTYAQSAEFKELSPEKQEAILSLKNITPEPMPQELNVKDFENLRLHFDDKTDKTQREAFLKLFEATKNKPDLVLEVLKEGELRQEFIKAFQHKETKDLYYLAILKDEREITGIPTTQVKKVMNDIANSERVLNAESFGEILNPAEPLHKQTSPQLSKEILPQNTNLSKKAKEPFKESESKIQAMEKDKIINIKTSGENKPIRALRDELKESLAPLLNQNITNKNTGETAFITNKSIQKMRSEKAIKKSLDNGFTRNEHFEAVKNIKELFENSKKAFESEGKKQNDKNLKIHRYNADLNINDKEANALITIKEVIEQGKRIYSLELEDLKAVKFKS